MITKKAVFLLVASVLAAFLTSCGPGSSGGATSESSGSDPVFNKAQADLKRFGDGPTKNLSPEDRAQVVDILLAYSNNVKWTAIMKQACLSSPLLEPVDVCKQMRQKCIDKSAGITDDVVQTELEKIAPQVKQLMLKQLEKTTLSANDFIFSFEVLDYHTKLESALECSPPNDYLDALGIISNKELIKFGWAFTKITDLKLVGQTFLPRLLR